MKEKEEKVGERAAYLVDIVAVTIPTAKTLTITNSHQSNQIVVGI